MTPTAHRACESIEKICAEHLANRYSIEIVDLLEKLPLTAGDQIIAVATLVRQPPPPVGEIIDDFSVTEKALVDLDVEPMSESKGADEAKP